MDTANVNKLGLTPLQAGSRSHRGAQAPLTSYQRCSRHLHTIGVNAFFDIGSDQDFADASQVISFYGAGGLGLPERDYYFRTDAKSVEQRKQYVDHVRKMFVLAGEPERRPPRTPTR